VAQYLMGLDLGSKKGCCLLLDVESGDAVSACRPWQHRMTAGFGYDLDTVEVWRFFGEATCEAMAKVGALPQGCLGDLYHRHAPWVGSGGCQRRSACNPDTGRARRAARPSAGGRTRARVS